MLKWKLEMSQCDFFLNNALSCLGFFVFVFAVSMNTSYLPPLLGNWEALLCCSACWCYHSRRNAGSVPFKPCVKLTFHTLHSVTFRNDVCTWLPLCILRECGERDFPPAVSHIPVHIGGPVLGPPVKCLHLCVHIPQPVSLPAPAFNHRPPEAQKYHLLQFLLPGVSKRRWEFFHQLGSLQYFLAKVHFFEPFLLKKMEESFSAVAAEVFPREISQEAGTSGKKCPFCSFSPIRPGSPPPSALISFSVHVAFCCECRSWCWQKCLHGEEFHLDHLMNLQLASWWGRPPCWPPEAELTWGGLAEEAGSGLCTSVSLTKPWNQRSQQ